MTSAECSAGLASARQERGKSTFSQPWDSPRQPAAREELAANLEGFLPATRNDRSGAYAVRQVDYQVVDGGHGRSAGSPRDSHGSTYSAPAVVLTIDHVAGERCSAQPQRLCSTIRPHSISVAMAIARAPMHQAERSS